MKLVKLILLLVLTVLINGIDAKLKLKAGTPHVFIPQHRPFADSLMKQLEVKSGFGITVFARNVCGARMLAVAKDSTVLVTCPDEGQVIALKDTTSNGVADKINIVVDFIQGVHGIEVYDENIYVATSRSIWLIKKDKDSYTAPELIVDDLPPGGQHPNRTLGIGPDEKLYISIGSECNACIEDNPEHATLIKMDLDGKNRTLHAKGLRNTIGFDWHPETGQMWGMDQGSDNRGDTLPPEELNLIEEGRDYGWPFVFGKWKIDPILGLPAKRKMSGTDYLLSTTPSVMEYSAHNSPVGFVFYKGEQFPAYYKNGAFITFRGSWNRRIPEGYKVVFLKFNEGKPVQFEDFIKGFLIENKTAQFGRLAGIAVLPDGSLIFCDDSNGMIYRVFRRR
ncbi:MAG TPA: PQQ-dependent sugar dehydrogenase [Mariniphaga sp.]|nr:PQQ-dependent sugar dehydrogenase [Mariniphaga sp.]